MNVRITLGARTWVSLGRCLVAAAVVLPPAAHAAEAFTYSVVHAFTDKSDGQRHVSVAFDGLTLASDGSLYGLSRGDAGRR
ncbi:MAG TPA: hypothetical protein VGQ91_11625, partial [Ideonella sp.]|nr:hypothetical protein [Ideonella sp.]